MSTPQQVAAAGPNALGVSLGLLGDEWTLLIVRASLRGPQRYTRLQHALGIAPSVLATRLAALTDAGVMVKVPDGARFAYALTPAGQELWALLLCIWAWEQTWVQGPTLPTMRHATCGEVFRPVLCCRGCHVPVGPDDVDIALGPAGDLSRAVPVGSNRRRGGGGRPDGPGLFTETMALMGSRWSSGVLGLSFLGVQRFTDFEAALGAPPQTVADRLRTFVALGVMDETYALTDKGKDFFPAVSMIVAWGERWFPAPDGPTLLAVHPACGRPFRPVLHCSACSVRLDPAALRVEAARPAAPSAAPPSAAPPSADLVELS